MSQLKSLFVDEQNSKRSCITFRFTIGPQLIVQFPKPNALSPLLQCKNDGPNVQRQNGELRVLVNVKVLTEESLIEPFGRVAKKNEESEVD